ncbi:MAG: 2TM domain-containing protein [Flavobacteriaceae bacterium]|nr:2TM domain-containing protein [Flavobacteriaceae bacterium]
MDSITKEERYLRAKKRITELKEFYIHLSVYIIVNLFLSGAQIVDGVTEAKSFTEIFSDMGMYGVWFMWGIGLCFHALKVFGSHSLLGKNWEAQKIKELMEQNKSN